MSVSPSVSAPQGLFSNPYLLLVLTVAMWGGHSVVSRMAVGDPGATSMRGAVGTIGLTVTTALGQTNQHENRRDGAAARRATVCMRGAAPPSAMFVNGGRRGGRPI